MGMLILAFVFVASDIFNYFILHSGICRKQEKNMLFLCRKLSVKQNFDPCPVHQIPFYMPPSFPPNKPEEADSGKKKMETLLKQRRVKFTGPDQHKPEESSKSRLKQRDSFKEGDKGQNWFERQFSGQSREAYENDSIDMDMAIAIAAAAFAIHSLEEDDREYQKKMRKKVVEVKTEDRRVEMARHPSSSSRTTRRSSNKEITVAGQDSAKRLTAQERHFSTAAQTGILSRVNIWEETRMEKIKKRCEKLKSDILSWENEKKMQAKRHMEAKKHELERRKASNLRHYQNKIARIEQVAGGAMAQVEQKRRNEEHEAKETAKKIQSTGKFPTRCLCF